MKTLILAAVVSAAFLTQHATAQMPVPPPPPPAGHGPAGPGPRPENTLQEITAFSGRVVKLANNDDYVYDGFYIINSGDSLLVKFPPHMGTQITKAAAVGNTVTVNGVQHLSPEGRKEVHMVSLNAGGQTITDTPPAAPAAAQAEASVSGSGKITAVQTGRMGEVRGVVLDGKTILHIPPHAAMQLGTAFQVGGSLSYTGSKKAADSGEAMSGNYTVVRAATLTVNGKQYLIQ